MIEKFINEITNTNNFHFKLKRIIKLAKIGSFIIYLSFLLSIIIKPDSIYITFWIALLSFFSLIIFSTNYFIFEKYELSTYLCKKSKDNCIEGDINFIENLILKYKLEKNIDDIKEYLQNSKCFNKFNWFNSVFILFLITIIFNFKIDYIFKLIYILIICIFILFMNKYITYVNNGLYDEKLSDYQYIYFCICVINKKNIS